jgi:hypothetical protein
VFYLLKQSHCDFFGMNNKEIVASYTATRRRRRQHRPVREDGFYLTEKGSEFAGGPDVNEPESTNKLQQFMRLLFGQPYAVGNKCNSRKELQEVVKWSVDGIDKSNVGEKDEQHLEWRAWARACHSDCADRYAHYMYVAHMNHFVSRSKPKKPKQQH